MPKHTERDFESAIEAGLTGSGGYESRAPSAYDEIFSLLPNDVTGFLENSQPAKWTALEALLGPKTATTVLDSLSKELDLKGTLHVLRHGFKCYGKTLRMAWFRPNTTMNPEAAENHAKNRLTITRQVAFTSVLRRPDGKNRRCIIDVTLAVNGVPVITAELKNPLTGQRAADAVRQYKEERDGRDLLFAFKKRALVHFAVDPDEVWMTTRLRGKETRFLPFNRGDNQGAGNPPIAGNWKTHYLWDEVLQADSLLEILQRFMHLEIKETQVRTDKGVRTVRNETMIFPRYHQLDSVRKLVAHARANGSGRNYLIQHSAGSGKSNSIAWLAHRLASLHDGQDEKVFHSVVVVTDRRVLDQQLQSTIYQFEHKTGVVEKIDEDTRQLAKALSQGTSIVVTTIQKFPFISQALSTLEKKGSGVKIDTAGKRFAVIVDEAHSSQSGETATALRGMLNKEGIEAAIAAQLSDEEDDDLSDEAKAAVLRDALRRARQPNLSFFAFTATPKFKTKALFDEPGPTGAPPFHEYTMRQAIEEGFILDVLQNYTTYKRFFGLIKQVENDPDVPRRKAAKILTHYLKLHPVNIEQVVSVIVEHFRLYVMSELGGRAKAMVVTGSRLAAVKYKLAFDRYIKDRGEEEREEFRGQLKAYRNLYAFLSQIIPYHDSDLERLYAFARNLLAKLPPAGDGHAFALDDEVALRFFRLQQMTEGSINLAEGYADPLKGPTDVGTAGVKDQEAPLSSLIDRLNERFGTDFTEADQLFFDQIRASAENNEDIAEVARANNFPDFSSYLDRMLDELFIARMEGNEAIFSRVMTDAEFRSAAHGHLAREIFLRVRDKQEADSAPSRSQAAGRT